jgi:hypothetical protein
VSIVVEARVEAHSSTNVQKTKRGSAARSSTMRRVFTEDGNMSLKEFLRKRLMLGSQYPSVEEEAENYLRELEVILESDEYRGLRDDPEFCAGVAAVLDLLKGGK